MDAELIDDYIYDQIKEIAVEERVINDLPQNKHCHIYRKTDQETVLLICDYRIDQAKSSG